MTCYQIGAEIKDFNAAQYFKEKKSAVRNDRYTSLGVAGAKLAVEDAGLDVSTIDPGGWVREANV